MNNAENEVAKVTMLINDDQIDGGDSWGNCVCYKRTT